MNYFPKLHLLLSVNKSEANLVQHKTCNHRCRFHRGVYVLQFEALGTCPLLMSQCKCISYISATATMGKWLFDFKRYL